VISGGLVPGLFARKDLDLSMAVASNSSKLGFNVGFESCPVQRINAENWASVQLRGIEP
jgi:hypothetical protein